MNKIATNRCFFFFSVFYSQFRLHVKIIDDYFIVMQLLIRNIEDIKKFFF